MVRAIIAFLALLITSNLLHHYESVFGIVILKIVLLMVSIYLIGREILVLWRFFTAYMFNVNDSNFNKKIERPRLFIYLTLGLISLLLLYLFITLDTSKIVNKHIISSLLLLGFLSCSYVLQFTWNKKFYENFVPKVTKQILSRSKKSFVINSFNTTSLKSHYDKLTTYDFIEIIDQEKEFEDSKIFSKTLNSGEIPPEPIFKLNMDNIQTKYYFDELSKNSNGFTLDVFLKIFKNKNDRSSRNSIEASYSHASSSPKRKDEIDKCFN